MTASKLVLEVRGFLGIKERVITCDGDFRTVIKPSEYGKTSEIDAFCWVLWDRTCTGDSVTGRMVRPDAPASEIDPTVRLASADLRLERNGQTVWRIRRRLGVSSDPSKASKKVLETLRGGRWVAAGAKEALEATGIADERCFYVFAPLAWTHTSPANNHKELRGVLERFYGAAEDTAKLVAAEMGRRGLKSYPGDATSAKVAEAQLRDARSQAKKAEGAYGQASATLADIEASLSELGPEPSAEQVEKARALLGKAAQWDAYERHTAGVVGATPEQIAEAEAAMAAETSPDVEAAEAELRRRESLVLALQAPPAPDASGVLAEQAQQRTALQLATSMLQALKTRPPARGQEPSDAALQVARGVLRKEEALAARGVCSECGAPTSHRSSALEGARAALKTAEAEYTEALEAFEEAYKAKTKEHEAAVSRQALEVEAARTAVAAADLAVQQARREADRIAAAHRSEVEQARKYAADARPAVDAARAALRERQAAARALLSQERNAPPPPNVPKPAAAFVQRARMIEENATAWRTSNAERRKTLARAKESEKGAGEALSVAVAEVGRVEALANAIREVERSVSGIPDRIGRFRVSLLDGGIDLSLPWGVAELDLFGRGPSGGLLMVSDASFRFALWAALPPEVREALPVAVDNVQDYTGPAGLESLDIGECTRVWAYGVPAEYKGGE